MSMGMDPTFEAPLQKVKRPDNWKEIVGNYNGPYKFRADMMMYGETPLHHSKTEQSTKSSGSLHKKKRRRATIVAEQNGKFLLVREKGAKRYSLPGGGIEKGEPEMVAALRELDEETKLRASQTEYLFQHEGQASHHYVVWAKVEGRVKLQKKELSDFVWWDGKETLPMLDSAKSILEKAMSAKAYSV